MTGLPYCGVAKPMHSYIEETWYDKTPDSYLAGLHPWALMIWIKELTRTTMRSRPNTRPNAAPSGPAALTP